MFCTCSPMLSGEFGCEPGGSCPMVDLRFLKQEKARWTPPWTVPPRTIDANIPWPRHAIWIDPLIMVVMCTAGILAAGSSLLILRLLPGTCLFLDRTVSNQFSFLKPIRKVGSHGWGTVDFQWKYDNNTCVAEKRTWLLWYGLSLNVLRFFRKSICLVDLML